jgi:hypothetical protein
MIKYLFTFILSSILYSQTSSEYINALNSISKDKIEGHHIILASDEFEGRGLGSNGIKMAAEYISNQFNNFGLSKPSLSNSYFQQIPMHASQPLKSSELIIYNNDKSYLLNYSIDYFLYKSGKQTLIHQPVEIVFVGYGIVAPEYDYNDYHSIDVEGKVVVYLDNEPLSNDENFFNGNLPTRYSLAEMKRRIAIARGAAGTILIPLEKFSDWSKVERDFYMEDVTLAYDISSNLSLIINTNVADILFEGSKYSLKDIFQMHNSKKMRSFNLNSKLKFKGVFKERNFVEKNVIGIIKGKDTKLNDSYILVSAHYDHFGIGREIKGDSIYNGALDNAIGVSVLIELARALSSVKLKRSIVFIATSGEERGLLGANYYTENPIIPLYKTIANLNIDGIAMYKDFSSLICPGKEFSTLGTLIKKTAKRFGLEIEELPEEFVSFGSFSNSDHFSFALAGIPSIIILEGTKNKSRSKQEVKNHLSSTSKIIIIPLLMI